MNRQQQEAAQILLKRVRDALQARGSKTIRQLGVCFRCLDSYDGNRKLDKNELKVGLGENGVQLSWNEVDVIISSNCRSYLLPWTEIEVEQLILMNSQYPQEQGILVFQGQLNPTRKAIVDQAFRKFDKTGDGYITADDLKGVYNAKMHPKVKNGQMTENQVFDEFLVNFGDVDKNGQLTYQEWCDYYAAVSASVDNDEHFVLLMKMAWKL